MLSTNDELIEKLKFEIEMIEKGRYYPSVRAARLQPEIFRDTITCPNAELTEKKYPCSSCFLNQFVPEELQNLPGETCHRIPLNENGDTIESLKAADDPYKLHETVLSWLKNTVAKLEEGPATNEWR